MYCSSCGKTSEANATFCAGCGRPQSTENQQSAMGQPLSGGQSGWGQNQSGQGGQHHGTSEPPRGNGMAVAGFILAFFSPLLGIIFSCIGLSKSKERNGAGRTLAIAGIIISVINFILGMIFLPQIMGMLEDMMQM